MYELFATNPIVRPSITRLSAAELCLSVAAADVGGRADYCSCCCLLPLALPLSPLLVLELLLLLLLLVLLPLLLLLLLLLLELG